MLFQPLHREIASQTAPVLPTARRRFSLGVLRLPLTAEKAKRPVAFRLGWGAQVVLAGLFARENFENGAVEFVVENAIADLAKFAEL